MVADGGVCELAEERGVGHPHGKPVQVPEDLREVMRWFDDAIMNAAGEDGDVLVGDLADEEERDELGVVVLDGGGRMNE